jgi:hypothetical protein
MHQPRSALNAALWTVQVFFGRFLQRYRKFMEEETE